MNTETAVVVSLVLAVLVLGILYSAGSGLFDIGESSLNETEENISNPEEDEKYWLEDTELKQEGIIEKGGLKSYEA